MYNYGSNPNAYTYAGQSAPQMQTGTAATGYPIAQPVPQPGQQGGTTQISPELAQAILNLNQRQSDQRKIDRQMQMANALRAQGTSPVQSTSPGGGRVGAPNWAQALANVYAAYKGGRMADDADMQQRNSDVQRQDALRRYFEAMSNSRGSSTQSYPGEEGE